MVKHTLKMNKAKDKRDAAVIKLTALNCVHNIRKQELEDLLTVIADVECRRDAAQLKVDELNKKINDLNSP